MQIDFHYYAVAVLARAAGFAPADALTLAYASQYTDDASESEPVRIGSGGACLDPVRTSYKGLEILGSYTWSSQKRVWIPFHFLPPHPFDPRNPGSFSFITRPAAQSTLASLLLKQVKSKPAGSYKTYLCRLGIALHTYADTWAHQGFSGRRERDNDVEAICVYHRQSGGKQRLRIENILYDTLPAIGHLEAGSLPDLSFLKFEYYQPATARLIQRDNCLEFLAAAQAIYRQLKQMPKSASADVISWEELKPHFSSLFLQGSLQPGLLPAGQPVQVETPLLKAGDAAQANDLQARCEAWQGEFTALFAHAQAPYAYDRLAWRSEALQGDVRWDDVPPAEWEQQPPRQARGDFWDSWWVHFHRAALRQRHWVLENLP